MNLVEVFRGVVLFFLAFFLAVFVFSFCLFSAAKVVLTPQFYIETLQESNAFDALPQALATSLNNSQFSSVLGNPLVTQNLKKQTYLLVTNLFAYLNGESASPNLVLQTTELKAALPMAAALPDSIDLVKQLPDLGKTLVQAKQTVSMVNASYWVFLIALLILVMVVFLLSWNLRRGMKWTGFGFILGSGVALLAFMVAQPMVASMLQQQAGHMPAGEVLRSVAEVAVKKIAGGGMQVSGAFFVAGLILLLAGFLWKKTDPAKKQVLPNVADSRESVPIPAQTN